MKSLTTLSELLEHACPEPNTGCWLWAMGLNSKGYGKVRDGDKHRAAHRLAWTLANGPIPRGLFVCHKCDTPACLNPEHLFLGTPKENSKDRDAKGRHNRAHGDRHRSKTCPESIPCGERHANAKLTESDVLIIRSAVGSQSEIATRFGVSQTLVSQVRLRKIWRHI